MDTVTSTAKTPQEPPLGTPNVKPPVALPFEISQEALAKLIVEGEPMLTPVHVYWGFRPNKYGIQKLTIFSEEEAQKLLADPETEKTVARFDSEWKLADWDEQNEIVRESQKEDPVTGQPVPDWGKYRELRIRKLLKTWNLNIKGQNVPVTEEYIRKVPDVIMLALFDRYERAGAISPEEQGK